ncbi:MAG: outer membrane protein assembly factor BamE [Pseudomonadota bacterium]|jgi:hypothetical protein|nr:outer membrane protein assembly factor BamE [Pseudomonadota bacterium]
MKSKLVITMLMPAMLSGCLSLMTTQQDVKKLSQITPGMSESEVIQIMGSPVSTEFSGARKAMHYCKTGWGSDAFAVVVLQSGKVVAAKNYGVGVSEAGGTGDCSKFVRNVDFRESDSVYEIRFR